MQSSEIKHLDELLYLAIFHPNDADPISREILKQPEIRIYIDNFGELKDDYCIVADLDGQIVGAVWVRILSGTPKGFGNIDDKTPEFTISLYKKYRNKGIGTKLMARMIEYLHMQTYERASLSVQKANYAVRLYQNMGFDIFKENEEDYLMLLNLNIKK